MIVTTYTSVEHIEISNRDLWNISEPLIIIKWESLISVSYTHLDVYKRQGYSPTHVVKKKKNFLATSHMV